MNQTELTKLAVVCCATESYTQAMIPQGRRVAANLKDFCPKSEYTERVLFILVGDSSDACKSISRFYREQGIPVKLIEIRDGHSEKKHKDVGDGMEENACLKISQMRTLAHDAARAFDADLCWSLDSDVLPPENALRCSMAMLEFDHGFYSVSTCPYPSNGGGGFLGGRGTPQQPILPDFYEDEKLLTDELKARIAKHDSLKPDKTPPVQEWIDEGQSIQEAIRKLPPQGNVYTMNGKRWRRRGWLDNAYPAIGRGAVLPTDWCGFGCTLMNRRALALATFEGYDGKGTEDLFVVWKRWYPAGLKLNVITHCPCDHVIPDRHSKDFRKWVYQRGYHEVGGDHDGHMRIESRPWYEGRDGEKYEPLNNGKLTNPPKLDIPAAGVAPPEAQSVTPEVDIPKLIPSDQTRVVMPEDRGAISKPKVQSNPAIPHKPKNKK